MSDQADDELIPVNPKAEKIEKEIEGLRNRLGRVVVELDHRRHRTFDVRGQLRRHAWAIGAGAVALAGCGVTAAILVRRRRRGRALRRAVERWFPVSVTIGRRKEERGGAAPGSLLLKLALSFGTGAAAIVGRRLAEQLTSSRRG